MVADQEAESLRPAIQVDPAEHDYGTVDVGSSATKIFVVGNTGTADLAVTEIALDGDNSDQFAIVSGGVTAGGNSSKVAPGATHKVEVSFKPTALWQKTARLDITSNDPARPAVKIELKGEVGVPAIRVEPPDNDYTQVNLGSSAAKIFVVRNTGTSVLKVTATTLSGSDSGQFDIGSGEISSGGDPLNVAPGGNPSGGGELQAH